MCCTALMERSKDIYFHKPVPLMTHVKKKSPGLILSTVKNFSGIYLSLNSYKSFLLAGKDLHSRPISKVYD